MKKKITIAIDAMGGENSPTKIIKGIEIHSLSTKDVFYNIFGDQKQIEPLIKKTKIFKSFKKNSFFKNPPSFEKTIPILSFVKTMLPFEILSISFSHL